jgi:Kef-type K+ transport system membrane component KefB
MVWRRNTLRLRPAGRGLRFMTELAASAPLAAAPVSAASSVMAAASSASAPSAASIVGVLEGLRGAEPVLGLALVMLVAVLVADALQRGLRWPRAVGWMLVGALAGPLALDLLQRGQLDPWKPLLDLAIGVLVFELGTRIRPRWLLDNRWLAASSLLEALLTAALVAWALVALGASQASALLAAAVAMSTSPVVVLQAVHEAHPRGQVTERLLILSALNSVLAVLMLKLVQAGGVLQGTGGAQDLAAAAFDVLYTVLGSLLLGALCGLLMQQLGRLVSGQASLTVLQIALVVLATLLAARWTLSPLLALLVAGMVARARMGHRLTVEPQLGTLGASLTVLLFVCLGLLFRFEGWTTLLGWTAAIVAARMLGKALGLLLTARPSGLSWRQAVAVWLGLQPMSGLLVLLAAGSFAWNVQLPGVDPQVLSALLAATAALQLSGPLWVQWALQRVAGEAAATERA